MTEITECPYKETCYKYKSNRCQDDTFCIKEFKLNQLSDQALLTISQRQYIPLRLDRDECDKQAFANLRNIELNIKQNINIGMNLYIYSHTTGNGKTAWGLRLLNKWLDTIWHSSDIKCRGLFVHVPRFLMSLKDNLFIERNEYAQHIKENALDADLIVWDEIGSKGFTEFETENILTLINARISAGKANIYTSNLSPEELLDSVGDRLYSRIINQSTVIQFTGLDKRGLL